MSSAVIVVREEVRSPFFVPFTPRQSLTILYGLIFLDAGGYMGGVPNWVRQTILPDYSLWPELVLYRLERHFEIEALRFN